jgi:YD repeat-containing protein
MQNYLVSYKTGFDYDSLDRLTRLTYPDADQLRYEYNDRNLLQRIPGGPSGSIIAGITYQPSAQTGQIDYGNGVRTTYAYDSRLRLRDLHTLSASGGKGQGALPLN